jgi:chorismate-pyruvate lyase
VYSPAGEAAVPEMSEPWRPLGDCGAHPPAELIPWLVEPGLLIDRVRALCAGQTRLRLLRLEPSELQGQIKLQLQVNDNRCLLREIEISCGKQRWIYAQSVLPDSTVDRFPWLRELGHSGLGESLSRAGGVTREAFEYLRLPAEHELALAAGAQETSAAPYWARRAVYRLDGWPLLVQEVFMSVLYGETRSLNDLETQK